ncbi:MAG: hypothetical protein O2999_00695 [Nitrospirae bacterium]|nr:hypothetical protein [Nitrospirota bacterium]MDA1302822.1 hypothetical protein [Nitrospirota bacterium]
MKASVAVVKILSVVCVMLLAQSQNVLAQEGAAKQATKTIVGDLLMIDRDLYIVRGKLGEIQIEATYKTEITEEFEFGDRIKALVLMNNKALKIERAGPGDVAGVVENSIVAAKASPAKKIEKGTAKTAAPGLAPAPKQPDRKTIIGDLLMIDRDLYIVRGEYGEIQIEATYKTEITEEFEFGDRIKAVVLMNNKALKIERAGANEVSGVTMQQAPSSTVPAKVKAELAQSAGAKGQAAQQTNPAPNKLPSDTRVVKGQILMIDGAFYVLRGEYGEIRVERTDKTKVTEEFKFGDFIRATVKNNDEALTIERLKN